MRQLFREFVVGKQAAIDRSDRAVTLAWMTAALSRAKKIPELRSLTSARFKKQTPEEQLLVMRKISAHLGIPLREVPRNGE